MLDYLLDLFYKYWDDKPADVPMMVFESKDPEHRKIINLIYNKESTERCTIPET